MLPFGVSDLSISIIVAIALFEGCIHSYDSYTQFGVNCKVVYDLVSLCLRDTYLDVVGLSIIKVAPQLCIHFRLGRLLFAILSVGVLISYSWEFLLLPL